MNKKYSFRCFSRILVLAEKPHPIKENGVAGEGCGDPIKLSPGSDGPRMLTKAMSPRSGQVSSLSEGTFAGLRQQRAGEANTYSVFHTLNLEAKVSTVEFSIRPSSHKLSFWWSMSFLQYLCLSYLR